MDRPGSSKPAAPGGKIRDLHIIYEDEALIVVNKPAGLLAVPLERRADALSLYDQVEAHLRPRGKRVPSSCTGSTATRRVSWSSPELVWRRIA